MVRTKILLTLAVCTVLLVSLLYTISTQVLLESYKEIEVSTMERDLIRVEGAIANESSALNIKLRDWAQWDDSYQFIQDRNEDYRISNLSDVTLINLEINFMAFVTRSGEVVFSRYVDLNEELPLPEDQITNEVIDHLSSPQGLELTSSGVIQVTDGLLLLESLPVTVSDGSGEPAGTLIFARFIDKTKLTRLAELTQLTVDMFPYINEAPELEHIRTTLQTQSPLVEPVSNNRIHGYFELKNTDGYPVGLVRVVDDREIFTQGQKTVGTFILISSGTTVLFGICMLILLEVLMFRRYIRLIQQVEAIDVEALSKANIHDVHTNDEIGRLAVKVNALLVALSRAQEKERTALALQKKTNEDLKKNLIDLENINKLMVGRELKMIELKEELERLRSKQ